MKVTLDLTDLVAKGQITKEEADRLGRLGSADTGALGSNILLSFGTVAVALGGGFLFPTAQSVIVMGAILFVLGLALILNQAAKWAVFAQFCVTVGALGIVGGVSFLSDGSPLVGAGLVVGLAVAAVVAQSGLLAALTILQLALVLGAGTAYWHASYFFGADRPAVTIAALAVANVDGEANIPLLSYRLMRGGAPTVYVCRNFACQMPVTTVEAVEGLLAKG